MPFLTKKNAVPDSDLLMQGALGAGSGLAWGDDVYSPSKESFGLNGVGLPASLGKTSQRRLCSNLECASGWTMPWRNRRGPGRLVE